MTFKFPRLHNAALIVETTKQINNKIISDKRVKQNFRQRAHSKGGHIDIQISLFTVHETRQLKKICHDMTFNSSLLFLKRPIFVQLLIQSVDSRR